MTSRRLLPIAILASLFLSLACPGGAQPTAGPAQVLAKGTPDAPIALPNAKGSLKFVVLGDFGTAEKREYSLATQMNTFHEAFPFETVVLVGDNLYGALGNHDAREQRFYKLFNMDGQLYYSLKAPNESVRFFMLDSTYPVPDQLAWLEKELQGAKEDWKIAVFHHPIYSSGGRHGSDLQLREKLEPLFIKYNVSVAFTGHDHFYERIKPQHGIVYYVVGSGGQLAIGDIGKGSPLTAKGFDTDNAFLAVEIRGDKMYFNAISTPGTIVDSGIIERRKPDEPS